MIPDSGIQTMLMHVKDYEMGSSGMHYLTWQCKYHLNSIFSKIFSN